jgi:hypothetical protein
LIHHREKYHVTDDMHRAALERLGWSVEEFEDGCKQSAEDAQAVSGVACAEPERVMTALPHKASTDPLPPPVCALQVADAVRKINATLIRRATMLDGAADDLKKGRGLGAGEGVGEAGEAPA